MVGEFTVSGNVANLNEAYAWGRNIFKVMEEMHRKSKAGFTVIGSLNGVLVIISKEAEG